MNRVIIVCLSLLTAISFLSCKKSTEDPDISTVTLISFPIQVIDSTSLGYHCRLEGAIMTPSIIKAKGYGFYVTGGSASGEFFPVGTGTIAGNVKTDFYVPVLNPNLQSIFYLALEKPQNGKDTLKSTDVNFFAAAPVTVSISNIPDNTTTIGSETFFGNAINADPSNYSITQVGIQYDLSSNTLSPTSPMVLNSSPSNAAVTALTALVPSGNFLKTTLYQYRFVVIIQNNNTGTQTTIYSTTNTFTSP